MNSRVFYTLIRLAVVCAALGLAAGCDDVSTAELKTPVYKTGLKDSDDNKTSAFRKDFPLQAASYDRNNESTFMSKYKGSVNFMKNDDVDPLPEGYKQAAQPYLKNLWLGYPFMYEYREARGHTYAIHDILEIDRIEPYDPARLKRELKGRGAEILKRDFPLRPEELYRRLGLHPGGEVRLAFTKTGNDFWAIRLK